MINENLNKLEKLERKVEELERKLQEKANKEETIREMEARLAGYQDVLRTEKDIILKKNFVVENRKAQKTGINEIILDPDVDNVVLQYFNHRKPRGLNHIFLGTASREGKNFNNTFQAVAIKNDDAPNIPNNGTIQFILLRDDYLKKDGTMDTTKSFPQIFIAPTEHYGFPDKGEIVGVSGSGVGGFAQLTYMESPTKTETLKGVIIDKDGIKLSTLPTSDPGITGVIWRDGNTLKIST